MPLTKLLIVMVKKGGNNPIHQREITHNDSGLIERDTKNDDPMLYAIEALKQVANHIPTLIGKVLDRDKKFSLRDGDRDTGCSNG